ncbi:hypothetical protein AVEN_230665-1 [Araneus ventricosus]|uniref:Uncharacterized protein n=1 Tax=Araneus ventricosus TaxID=182803 RepID=A0A4Y2A325_ARAVE|nr:hypothetical protein AVEN_230665-1 [Araneus ventricosus]
MKGGSSMEASLNHNALRPLSIGESHVRDSIPSKTFCVSEYTLNTVGYKVLLLVWGRGGLVVRSGLRGWRAPDSKPDSIEEPPCERAKTVEAKRSSVGPARKLAEGDAGLGVVLVI